MMQAAPGANTLTVTDLSVEFRTSERVVQAVRGLSFDIGRGETVAIVGESGSGKSVTALSLMRLVEHGGGRIVSGKLEFSRPDGESVDLAQASAATMRTIRGAEIAMIFQEPMTSLNPVFTVGEQIAESIRLHQKMDFAAARGEALRMLQQVRIPDAANVLSRYPHQLSGGMRQRVMIAMALSCDPELLIADEPTTALDVTIQAQILDLLRELVAERDTALIMITHDLGVVAGICERVEVMYAGTFVEGGTARQIFARPRHPYTLGLLESVPRLDTRRLAALKAIGGQPRDMLEPPSSCPFAPRCRYREARCEAELPRLRDVELEHEVACFYPVDVDAWDLSSSGASA